MADYLVFAQESGAAPDPAVLAAQARRFFATEELAARNVAVRPATEDDWAAAEQAEARTGAAASGLSRLARRCATVMIVACEADDPDDRGALLLAAVLASVHLGPILDPARERIFGVRTARVMLGV